MVRPHHVRVHRAGMAVLVLALIAGCAPAPAVLTSASASDPAAACGQPSTPFATFWYLTAGSDQGIFYQGTFRVGSARVPS